MKEQRAQELFDAMGELESSMVEQAYVVDSAEKLKSLCEAEAETGRRRVRPVRGVHRRVAVICASVAVVLGITLGLFALPSLWGSGGNLEEFPLLSPDQQEEQPSLGWDDILANATGEIVINNLDKLNYYAAMWLMGGAESDVMQGAAPQPIPLTLTEGEIGYDNGYAVDTPPVEELPPEEQSPTLDNPQPSQGSGSSIGGEYWVGDKVVYYALEPSDRYTIDEVLSFQIEISDPAGFLASRIGTGVVDVVITSNNLEPMITFRNGNLFYSCLISGGGNGRMHFSTHKYIEGFYIVKNLEQDNFAFNVTMDKNGVREIVCHRYKSGASVEEQIYTPDTIRLLTGGVRQQVTGSFSVAELQQYYDTLDSQAQE